MTRCGACRNHPCAIALLLFIAPAAFFPGCGGDQAPRSESIGVVVSILPQAYLVERVAGDRADVTVMIPPGANPHIYEPTPGQLAAVSRASIYAKVGSGIEFELAWFDRIAAMNDSLHVIDCSDGIPLSDTERGTHNSHDHVHEAPDPHIWVSPRNAAVMAENLYRGFATVDPAHESYYAANRDRLLAELARLDESITRALEGKTTRTFIVLHPAWGYLARHYGLEQIPIEAQGKEASARDVIEIVSVAREHGIRVVFASPQFNDDAAVVIAGEIGGTVIHVDPLAKDYTANLETVIEAFARSMR